MTYVFLNENALYKTYNIHMFEEGFIDAMRKQLEQDAKKLQAQKAAVYYTWKNGKLFFFFDRQALGITDAISYWFKNIWNTVFRAVFRVPKPELEFDIKKGADIHDVAQVLKYYSAHKDLNAIRYNKLCNTWSYLIIPGIKGPVFEKLVRSLIKKLNGVAIPESVLKDPSVLNEVINCSKDSESSKNNKDNKN